MSLTTRGARDKAQSSRDGKTGTLNTVPRERE